MKRKHVPIRTCVGCRQARPKKELIRVVRTPQSEIEIDLTGKKSDAVRTVIQECLQSFQGAS